MSFGETYASVGKLTRFRYRISLIGRNAWNIDHFNVVTTFLNTGIDNNDIYLTFAEGWPEDLNARKIVVRLRKALYGLKQAPQLWRDNHNVCLLFLGFSKSSADVNLYVRSDGIPIFLYAHYISISYPEAVTKAAIKVKPKLSEK